MEMHRNISVSESLKAWLDERVSSAGYGTTSALVEELLRKEQEREAFSRLDEQLLKELQEESKPMTQEDWIFIRSEGQRLAGERRKA